MPALDDSQSSTRALIRRGRAGDRSAWDQVFGRVTKRLRVWAHGRVPTSSLGAAETHDVVQDAALGVWHRIDQLDFRKPGDLEAYARQAVINRLRDQARRRLARPLIVPIDTGVMDDAPSALDQVLDAEAMARYQAAFSALDIKDRQALIARSEMGYSFEQIAQLVGKPSANAARMAVVRAIEILRKAVEDQSE
jgi:RNA polymerase sigma-70 factor (ECF subfamily)